MWDLRDVTVGHPWHLQPLPSPGWGHLGQVRAQCVSPGPAGCLLLLFPQPVSRGKGR